MRPQRYDTAPRHVDIAPTVAYIYGLDPDTALPNAVGRPLAEAFAQLGHVSGYTYAAIGTVRAGNAGTITVKRQTT